MITWTESIAEWDRHLPVVLVAPRATAEERYALARGLVAVALAVPAHEVRFETARNRPPKVTHPSNSGLCLSMASRGSWEAIALAACPIGVDVEVADAGEIPWNVLHRHEAALLAREDGTARARAFARLWSLKEAYLKALGLGLSREPESFAVLFIDAQAAVVEDPSAPQSSVHARTAWREIDGVQAAISAVLLETGASGVDRR